MNSTLRLRSAGLSRFSTKDGCRDASAVEEIRREPDDRLEEVLLQQDLADLALRGAPEQHAAGMTTPSRPEALSTATMCCTNARSPLVFGGTPNRNRP